MNASCGDKKTKGRETQQEYRPPSLTQMAPLFSRFHVNDAGTPGLTSNRVAFHEQFTVSLQRFVQLSAPCRPSASPCSCSEECGLKECHHLSAVHMPVAVTCTKTQGFSCPFFGTTTVCDSKSTGSHTLSNMVVMTTKGDNLKNTAPKTADAYVPSDHTTLDKAESNDGQPVYDIPIADMTKLVKRAHSLSIGDRLRSVCDSGQADLASQSEGHAVLGCENAGDAGKIIVRDDVPLTVSKPYQDTSCKEHDRALSSECYSDSNKIEKVSQSKGSDGEEVPLDRPISSDVGVLGPCSAEGHTDIIEDDFERCREILPDAKCACNSMVEGSPKAEAETGLPSRETEVSPKPLEGLSSILDTSDRENTDNTTSDMACFPVRSKCGACGESANKNSCHCGAAKSSQEDIDMGNRLIDPEPSSLSPKAVIQEIGQLKFWKARLALIRQQRIFSDQVFELHKLIEVQRLLAGTPQTSIDEIYFGVGNMNLECGPDAFASNNCLVDKNENFGDALGKQILVPKTSS